MGRVVHSLRERDEHLRASSEPAPPAETPTQFATASHDALFQTAPQARCDVCSAEIETDGDGWSGGCGAYVWSRGGDVQRERAPLCPNCGIAILVGAYGFFDEGEE